MGSLGEVVKKHQEGAVLNILVNTGVKKNVFPAGFNKWRKRIEIKVKSPPKENQANIDVIKSIASFFDISVKKVWIIKGKTSKEKTILLKSVSVNAASKKIKESLDGL
jgi:uncharacterized protein (TIGR00251 family)